MHLKRYRRPTMQQALARAREELGPRALVLSTRVLRVTGWRGWVGGREVELTVAVDRLSESRPVARRIRPLARRVEAGAGTRRCAGGLDLDPAGEVAAALPGPRRRGASVLNLRDALARRLADLATGDEPHANVEVFVGPPGAGKTTTIAKIAAQARVHRGVPLALIAADGYRVGAVEQLRLYAEIIGARFTIARSGAELQRALGHIRPPMLVDTAGRSPADPAAHDLFERLALRGSVRTHLVLAAGTAPRDAERVFDRYQSARPTRVVLTKLDETDSVAPLVRVLRDRRIPISYVGTGQRVPEDLQRATPTLLAAWMLGETADAPGSIA
jgi:flagellar biosynthesis protein FlhF